MADSPPAADEVAELMSHWVDDRPAGHPETVVYLGLNDASREAERSAFFGRKDATLVTGAGRDPAMQGKVMAQDGKTVLDLANEADLETYFNELGVGRVRRGSNGDAVEKPEDAAARMAALTDLFLGSRTKEGAREYGLDAGARDEMAGFLEVLQNVEQGDAYMDRLVMSGHSGGSKVYSEAEGGPGVSFDQMRRLMKLFPHARDGVQDLMLSACHTLEGSLGQPDDGQRYKEIFPELESVWGYDGVSPNYEQGSPWHIRGFLEASQGDDPAKVVAKAQGRGQNATARTFGGDE